MAEEKGEENKKDEKKDVTVQAPCLGVSGSTKGHRR